MDSRKEPDLEEHLILRLPEEYAVILDQKLRTNSLALNELKIKAKSERFFQIEFAGQILEGVMGDLPCVIESQKTLDNEMFYKSADISQILICSRPGEPADTTQLFKDFRYPHGLTAPLQDVRLSRFRKTKRVRRKRAAEIEAELSALLKDDSSAWKVEYELITLEHEFLGEEDDELDQEQYNEEEEYDEEEYDEDMEEEEEELDSQEEEEYDEEIENELFNDQTKGRATSNASEIEQLYDDYDDLGLDTEISDFDDSDE